MKKRICALSLTLLLLLSVLPLSAGAADYFPFTDVPETSPLRVSVQYVYDKGLMNGVGHNLFAPETGFTRAMFVTILGRMEGIDPSDYPGAPFTDVSPSDPSLSWSAPYIQWAVENSIVNGVGHGKFDPNAGITREQYCTIILRYFISMEGQLSPTPPLFLPLTDSGDISGYAAESVRAMVGYGLIDPTPDGAFLPRQSMNRGEIARTFSRVHAYRNTGTVPRALLTENTPDCLLFGAVTRQVGTYQVLKDRKPTDTEFDSRFSITQTGYTATGFHSGADNSDCLYSVDSTRSDLITPRGITVGSTRAQVQAAYPENLHKGGFRPYTGDFLWYNGTSEDGAGWSLFFWFKNDQVTRILSSYLSD